MNMLKGCRVLQQDKVTENWLCWYHNVGQGFFANKDGHFNIFDY